MKIGLQRKDCASNLSSNDGLIVDYKLSNADQRDCSGNQLELSSLAKLAKEKDVKLLNELGGLAKLAKEKDVKRLNELGGVKAIAKALNVNTGKGLQTEEISQKRSEFGANTFDKPPEKGFFSFVYAALKDIANLNVLVSAILLFGFAINYRASSGWYGGGSLIVAMCLFVILSATIKFKLSRKFAKLSEISNNIQVKVVDVFRDGRTKEISVVDIVVGDIVHLNTRDQIPADGLLCTSHLLHVNEWSITGEIENVKVDRRGHPFLLSGTKVVNGHGHMLVTSVGRNTTWGERMITVSPDNEEETQLQSRLDMLTFLKRTISLLVAFVALVILLTRFFSGNIKHKYGSEDSIINSVIRPILSFVLDGVNILVVTEGLPLVMMLTLAYSTKRMMADNAIVRKLSACETMGSTTIICTDTGALTLNQMKVTKFWLGLESIKDVSASTIPATVLQLIHQGVYRSNTKSEPEITGSQMEKAILSWAVAETGMDIEGMNQKLCVEPFNSEENRSGVLIRNKEDSSIHVHWKADAKMILAMCSNYYGRNGMINAMGIDVRIKFQNIILGMTVDGLRGVAFAHKQTEKGKFPEDGLTLVGIVGIRNPCQKGAKEAIKTFQDAGVKIQIITGDNVFTARAIAINCGIFDSDLEANDELVVEGEEFRNYTDKERMKKVNKIRVMARSSPSDKRLMVRCLKMKGHVVAATGNEMKDAPVLKEADIGLSLGSQVTEVARESSDMEILDDNNFDSVVKVFQWGRCVYNNIQKFMQFQLTVNIIALVINFVATASAGEVPLSLVKLSWVNFIMDTLAALAIATEKPMPELMRTPPICRTAPLITNIMWRNILLEATFQILVLSTLAISSVTVTDKVRNTMIFNTFVMCQVFNFFNTRSLEKKNVFKGIHKNKFFLAVVGFIIVLQIIIVEFLGKFADTERLDWRQWGVCIGVGSLTWPIAWVVKCIPVPEEPISSIIKNCFSTKRVEL